MNGKIVVTLAGRRVDAPGAPERFPLSRVVAVEERLSDLLLERQAGTIVCSGACGTDLVGLEAARELGLRRRLVLPFSPERFRETSVIDRPGDWGPTFDALVCEAREAEDLVVLESSGDDSADYLRANEIILDEALALAGDVDHVLAVIVWEGQPRGEDDATYLFASRARERGMAVEEVLSV